MRLNLPLVKKHNYLYPMYKRDKLWTQKNHVSIMKISRVISPLEYPGFQVLLSYWAIHLLDRYILCYLIFFLSNIFLVLLFEALTSSKCITNFFQAFEKCIELYICDLCTYCKYLIIKQKFPLENLKQIRANIDRHLYQIKNVLHALCYHYHI